jgi:GNAT superfamily N-acetyltransferase
MNPTIRLMTAADIPSGMRLKEQNLWNTTPDDWQRQLDLEPAGCFAAELDGQVVGTACACIFDNVAWLNLVLVNQVHRGRGIGTSLMRTVLAWLDGSNIPSIRLDATPLGRPIYEKLGFTAEYDLTRYEGTMPVLPADLTGHWATVPDRRILPRIVQLDRRVTGTNRDKLIRYLNRRQNLFIVRRKGEVAGYASYRPGSRARHIGPCAGDAPACRELLAAIGDEVRGQPVFMDIPIPHAEANAFAASLGLAPQRRLTRMGRGVRIHEQLDQYWCSFGPEKG